MPGQIHGVVQDADHLDRLVTGNSVHNEMPSAFPTPADVESTETWKDLVTRGAAGDVWPVFKHGKRFGQHGFIDIELMSPERVPGPREDTCEVVVGFVAEPNTPDWRRQRLLGIPFHTDPLGDEVHVLGQRGGIRELFEIATVERRNAELGGSA